MKNKLIENVMNVLLGISGFLVLTGAIFKLQHWAYGNQILWIGFMASFVFSSIEINRLKKVIKTLEKNTSGVN